MEPTRDSVHLSLLETLKGIGQTHSSLTVEKGIDSYILSQIYGESSLTLPDAQKMLAWVAAQKASQGQPLNVADLRGEIARLPVIDKLPIARRVRAVAGKVTPEIREKIFKIANELRRAGPRRQRKLRSEQYLDTVLGLFFWKNVRVPSRPKSEKLSIRPFENKPKTDLSKNIPA